MKHVYSQKETIAFFTLQFFQIYAISPIQLQQNQHTTVQATRRPLCCVVCVSIWSDMLQGESKCKSHVAQSLSEYSIKHISKPGQNTKDITLQVFQLSQSSFHVFRPQRVWAGHPRLLWCNLFTIHQRASNPWTDRSCPRRNFLSRWKMPATKESWIYWEVSQLAASAGLSTQVSQTTTFLNEQLCPAWAAVSGWVMAPRLGKLL